MPHHLLPELERVCGEALAAQPFGLHAVHLHSHRLPLTLQVMVERRDGGDVSLDDCAALSGPLGEAIEAADLLPEAYVLEVSSAGIGEDLQQERDFRSFRGFPVAVQWQDPSGGEHSSEGLLLEREAGDLLLNQRGRTRRIPWEAVRRVRLTTPRDGP